MFNCIQFHSTMIAGKCPWCGVDVFEAGFKYDESCNLSLDHVVKFLVEIFKITVASLPPEARPDIAVIDELIANLYDDAQLIENARAMFGLQSDQTPTEEQLKETATTITANRVERVVKGETGQSRRNRSRAGEG